MTVSPLTGDNIKSITDNDARCRADRISRGCKRVTSAGLIDRQAAECGLSCCRVERNRCCSAQGSTRPALFWIVQRYVL